MEKEQADSGARPVRILHFVGGLNIGGIQTMAINLLNAVDRNLVQFDFLLDHDDATALVPAVEPLGAKVFFVPRFRGSNILDVWRKWDDFFTGHPEYRILHCHVRSYASLVFPIVKKHGVIAIMHSHNTSNGTGILAGIKRCLQYPLRFQADYFFSCSPAAGKWLFGKKVTEGDRYRVLPNAIFVEQYRFRQDVREQYRKELHLEGRSVYIHIGRFFQAKNHFFLLEVFKRIRDDDEKAVLLLVGDGELRDEIEARIGQLKLGGAVMLLGVRDDVPQLLQAADCFLYPSLWEGLPLVLVEAQASGLPCLISDLLSVDTIDFGLLRRIPLRQGPDYWAAAAGQENLSRPDVTDKLRAAGYDVHNTAEWLTGFYLELLSPNGQPRTTIEK